MQLYLKKSTLYKGLLLYRKIRHSKGHGVHSPFVYNLITKVINERCPFYKFQDIELLRKRLLQTEEIITYPDKKHPGETKSTTISNLVKRKAISPRKGALLFRLVNYLQSEKVLQIGPSMGLSTLYLSSYSQKVNCISLESIPEYATISQWIYGQIKNKNVDLRIGDYKTLLPEILSQAEFPDFVFFNRHVEPADMYWMFTTCMPYKKENTVFVIEGIHSNQERRNIWKEIRSLKDITVSLDLYSMGIIFFNKKLYKRNYTVYFKS